MKKEEKEEEKESVGMCADKERKGRKRNHRMYSRKNEGYGLCY